MAITDHDGVAALAPARAAAGPNLEVIAGVEISATFHSKEFHLLGYFFRPDHEGLGRALAGLQRERNNRFHEMVERLQHLGVHFENGPLAEARRAGLEGTTILGRRHLAEMLVKAGRADTVRQAFQRYLGDRGRVSVPKRCLPVAEAIALIRAAGGVASWAHPSDACTPESLRELRGLGMQAVEVDFPSCRHGRRLQLRAWASELGLAITGGSDCHGPGLPQRAVGACGISSADLEALRQKIGD